jgi:hypothetical protein
MKVMMFLFFVNLIINSCFFLLSRLSKCLSLWEYLLLRFIFRICVSSSVLYSTAVNLKLNTKFSTSASVNICRLLWTNYCRNFSRQGFHEWGNLRCMHSFYTDSVLSVGEYIYYDINTSKYVAHLTKWFGLPDVATENLFLLPYSTHTK